MIFIILIELSLYLNTTTGTKEEELVPSKDC